MGRRVCVRECALPLRTHFCTRVMFAWRIMPLRVCARHLARDIARFAWRASIGASWNIFAASRAFCDRTDTRYRNLEIVATPRYVFATRTTHASHRER